MLKSHPHCIYICKAFVFQTNWLRKHSKRESHQAAVWPKKPVEAISPVVSCEVGKTANSPYIFGHLGYAIWPADMRTKRCNWIAKRAGSLIMCVAGLERIALGPFSLCKYIAHRANCQRWISVRTLLPWQNVTRRWQCQPVKQGLGTVCSVYHLVPLERWVVWSIYIYIHLLTDLTRLYCVGVVYITYPDTLMLCFSTRVAPGSFKPAWHVDFVFFDAPGWFKPSWHVNFMFFDAPGWFEPSWHVDFVFFDVPGGSNGPGISISCFLTRRGGLN